MTALASHIATFLRERLPIERGASEHTCSTYAYAFQLLFESASLRLHITPSQLQIEHIDADLVLVFLEHLESERNNAPRTRNARLAAIKSFMRFLEHRVPSALEQIRCVLAIPAKRVDGRLVDYLTREETQSLLDAPDLTARSGIRDRAMLFLAVAAGLRVSELIGLHVDDLTFQPGFSIRVRGKGRKERALPLWEETASTLRGWLTARGHPSTPELFINARGGPLSRSGFRYILDKHVKNVRENCVSLCGKTISPHVLRHTCAMVVLQATRDTRKVSLWLGHASIQTTEIYTRASPVESLEVIGAMKPPDLKSGHFRIPDKLISMLAAGPGEPELCAANTAKEPAE